MNSSYSSEPPYPHGILGEEIGDSYGLGFVHGQNHFAHPHSPARADSDDGFYWFMHSLLENRRVESGRGASRHAEGDEAQRALRRFQSRRAPGAQRPRPRAVSRKSFQPSSGAEDLRRTRMQGQVAYAEVTKYLDKKAKSRDEHVVAPVPAKGRAPTFPTSSWTSLRWQPEATRRPRPCPGRGSRSPDADHERPGDHFPRTSRFDAMFGKGSGEVRRLLAMHASGKWLIGPELARTGPDQGSSGDTALDERPPFGSHVTL